MELKRPASSPQTMYCWRPNHQSANPVATATMRLVRIWTRMKVAICSLMSLRI